MIASQLPAQAKRPHAHYVIDNDGSIADLTAHVDRLWGALLAHARRRP
jgi:dephospho-CoA kinase